MPNSPVAPSTVDRYNSPNPGSGAKRKLFGGDVGKNTGGSNAVTMQSQEKPRQQTVAFTVQSV